MRVLIFLTYMLLMFGKDAGAIYNAREYGMQHGHTSISKSKVDSQFRNIHHQDHYGTSNCILHHDQDQDSEDINDVIEPSNPDFQFNGICFQMQAIIFMLQSDGKDETTRLQDIPTPIVISNVYLSNKVLLI